MLLETANASTSAIGSNILAIFEDFRCLLISKANNSKVEKGPERLIFFPWRFQIFALKHL